MFAYFLSILHRKKRKVGNVREDALVITKIPYSRGASNRVEQYIRLRNHEHCKNDTRKEPKIEQQLKS